MKPKNFPARKLRRRLIAQGKDINSEKYRLALENERTKRTKKNREKNK